MVVANLFHRISTYALIHVKLICAEKYANCKIEHIPCVVKIMVIVLVVVLLVLVGGIGGDVGGGVCQSGLCNNNI